MLENILDFNGNVLNAKFEIGSDEGKEGLVLHSWSGQKNSAYNSALEIVLKRLQNLNIKAIRIFIVSKDLLKFFNQKDREVLLKGKEIIIANSDINRLRKDIGSEQTKIKINPQSKGGNPTKKILLYSPNVSSELWKDIALNKSKNVTTLKEFNEALEKKITESKLMRGGREERLKKANKRPEEIEVVSKTFKRNADVITAVLDRANGFCEKCESKAPFIRAKDNTPYLEVHHVIQLADGGEDSVENAIAVCPNCHRECHYGI